MIGKVLEEVLKKYYKGSYRLQVVGKDETSNLNQNESNRQDRFISEQISLNKDKSLDFIKSNAK